MAYRSHPPLSRAFHPKESLGSAIWAPALQEIHIKDDFEVKQLRPHSKPESGLWGNKVSRSVVFQRLHFNVLQNIKKKIKKKKTLLNFKLWPSIPLEGADTPTLTSVGGHVSPGAGWNCLENNVIPLTWIAEKPNWTFQQTCFFLHNTFHDAECGEWEMHEMP